MHALLSVCMFAFLVVVFYSCGVFKRGAMLSLLLLSLTLKL